MKLLLTILLSWTLMYAQKVEISADNFEADEKKMLSTLTGNVTLKKGSDVVNADTLVIYFDKKNRPTSYLATGHITFDIKTDNQNFNGKANTLRYNPDTLKYEIYGNVFIHEQNQNRKLYGEKIIINRISGKSTIQGSKTKPVKFIFEVEE